MSAEFAVWPTLFLLGAYHGINPAMGWLFAVALGLQERSRWATGRALLALAAGHAAAIAAALAGAELLGRFVPISLVSAAAGVALIGFGIYKLRVRRHPRFGGMRVGGRDLAVWSFLMASAHGAGFMVLPFVMELPTGVTAAMSGHAGHIAASASDAGALAIGVHTLAYLLVTACVAWVVYWKVGLSRLRTAWINMDWLWAGALVLTGAVVLFT